MLAGLVNVRNDMPSAWSGTRQNTCFRESVAAQKPECSTMDARVAFIRVVLALALVVLVSGGCTHQSVRPWHVCARPAASSCPPLHRLHHVLTAT
jgi:hypothetical protein